MTRPVNDLARSFIVLLRRMCVLASGMLCFGGSVLGCPRDESTTRHDSVPTQVASSETASRAPDLVHGIDHRTTTIPSTGIVAEVFTLDLARTRLVALVPPSGTQVAPVSELREQHGVQVAINGTFFDENHRSLGLLFDTDTRVSPVRNADWGVFEISADGTARLVHTREYATSEHAEFGVQCGPRVVIDGRVPALKPQAARRTALCVRDPHRVVLVVTHGPIDATQFGDWMARTTETGGLGCRDALLLDGGPSAQVSARLDGKTLEVPGGWPVPNGIGVVHRPAT